MKMFNLESSLAKGANDLATAGIVTSVAAVVVPFLLKLAAIFVVWFVGAKLIKVARKIIKKALEKSGADLGLVTFLDNFAKLGLYALLVVIILGMFDVDMASIAAVIASAGVAVGLALQGSLSNLAGGVLIILLKPFKVGDYIVAAGVEGTVYAIQMFVTKLVTPDNRVVIVPNSTLSSGTITNVSAKDKRRLDIAASIAYTADLKLAKDVLKGLLEDCEYVMKDEVYDVFVSNLGASSVDLNVRFWVKSSDYWTAKAYITENIKVKLDANNIEIPYNKLDVQIQK